MISFFCFCFTVLTFFNKLQKWLNKKGNGGREGGIADSSKGERSIMMKKKPLPAVKFSLFLSPHFVHPLMGGFVLFLVGP